MTQSEVLYLFFKNDVCNKIDVVLYQNGDEDPVAVLRGCGV